MIKAKTSYDRDADVLYINFYDPPRKAHESRRIGNFLLRYRWGDFIGMTILDASSLLDPKGEDGEVE